MTSPVSHRSARRPGLGVNGWVGAVLFFAFAAVVLVAHLADDPGGPGQTAAGLTMAALYATPGVMALLSMRDRPDLLAAGGALGLALVPTSMSITPLLVFPSVMLFVAHGRAPRPGYEGARTLLIVLVAMISGYAAFLAWWVGFPPCRDAGTAGAGTEGSCRVLTSLAVTAGMLLSTAALAHSPRLSAKDPAGDLRSDGPSHPRPE